MTIFLRKIIQYKLKFFAKIYLARTKPVIIVIAGTTNRHWVKEYILDMLRNKKLSFRGNEKNFNAEIGLPLSILGLKPESSEESQLKRWFKIIWQGAIIALGGLNKVEYLVLEMAIDKPDDIDYLLSFISPRIAVFTTITMIYPENFDHLDEIALEYRKLAKILPSDGLALLNADDPRISQLKQYAKAKVLTYAIENQNADYLISDAKKSVTGQEFVLHTPDMQSLRIKTNRFGRHHIYAEMVKRVVGDTLSANSQALNLE